MAEGQPPAIVTEIKRADFAPSLTVVGEKKERFEVAVNAVANRADAQITVSKLKRLLDKTVQVYLEEGAMAPDPLTLSRLTSAAESIVNMSMSAYESKDVKDGGHGMASYAEGLLKAAAEGLSAGAKTSYDRRREEMANLGKKRAATEIEVKNVTPAQ